MAESAGKCERCGGGDMVRDPREGPDYRYCLACGHEPLSDLALLRQREAISEYNSWPAGRRRRGASSNGMTL